MLAPNLGANIGSFLSMFPYSNRKGTQKYVNSKEVREEKKAVAKSLGEALKENRIRCQMTQEFVAETLCVSRQSVSTWENGVSHTLEAAARDINDIAGVRVVCNYIDDVYRVAGMLERQEDLEIVKRQDYIKTPNYNGYRSLHLDVRVPVYLSNRTEHVVAEIQIRTIAMDFWASLEHDIHYKADRAKLPAGIDEEMFACAEKIAEIDQQMQDMYRRIADAEANGDAAKK